VIHRPPDRDPAKHRRDDSRTVVGTPQSIDDLNQSDVIDL